MDQAETLRTLSVDSHEQKKSYLCDFHAGGSNQNIKVIAVTSGKGGVGKTNVVANLACALSRIGKKVLIMDADLGLANIDVLLGLSPQYTLHDVLKGGKDINDIIIRGPGTTKILPAATGIQELAELGKEQKINLLDAMDRIQEDFDVLLIDTGAGISSNVTFFSTSAQEIIIVVSPEPTSITDAYALIKVLANKYFESKFNVLVNLATDENEAFNIFAQINRVADRFLQVSLNYLGYIPYDENVIKSVRRQKAVFELYPSARSSKRFYTLAHAIDRLEPGKLPKGNIQFFWRQMISGIW